MPSNRLSGFYPSTQGPLAAPALTGPATSGGMVMVPAAMMAYVIAQQMALRELLAAAERRGAQRAVEASLRTTN